MHTKNNIMIPEILQISRKRGCVLDNESSTINIVLQKIVIMIELSVIDISPSSL